jgi:ankyrin repeat protein
MEAGCHGNTQDDIGRTPLMHACAAGDARLASALIGRGADPAAPDRWGMVRLFACRSVLYWAIRLQAPVLDLYAVLPLLCQHLAKY